MLDDTLRQLRRQLPRHRDRAARRPPGRLCARRCAAATSRWSLLPQRTHDLDDLHYYPVGEDRLLAIMPASHRARGAATAVPLEMLADLPLVCGDGCPFWEATERSFREAGLTVTPKAIATRAEWLYELVSAGVGIGVAAHARRSAGGPGHPAGRGCRARRHDINLTTKRGRLYSPPVKAFVDLALKPRPRAQPASRGRLSERSIAATISSGSARRDQSASPKA